MDEMLPQDPAQRQRLIEALMGQQGQGGMPAGGGMLQALQQATRGLPQGGAMAIPSGLLHGALQGLNLQRMGLGQQKPPMPAAPPIPGVGG